MTANNTPRDYLRALTCGMTTADRNRRVFAMLRAHVDESSSGGRDGIFVIAGYVGFPSQWDDFINPWGSTLGAPPAVPYFRMSSFRDPEWRRQHSITKEQAQAKEDALAECLRDKFLFSTTCTVSKADFDNTIRPHARRIGNKDTWLKTPYNLCFQWLVTITLIKLGKLGIVGDIVDFVFDDNDALFDDANKMFRELKRTQAEPYRGMIGDAIPGNDKRLYPLQAADLFAGRMKDYCMEPVNKSKKDLVYTVSGRGDSNVTKQSSHWIFRTGQPWQPTVSTCEPLPSADIARHLPQTPLPQPPKPRLPGPPLRSWEQR